MKPPFLILMIVAMLATSAHARVGETVEQVEARYGKPEKVFTDRADLRKVGYSYRGFMIMVYFRDGISKRESFGRPNGTKLPRKTLDELLALSARAGTSWQPISTGGGDPSWLSSDGKVIAGCAAPRTVFLVQDRNFKSSE